MSNLNIQTKLNEYQRKYPSYTKDKIVDLMLNDGVINFDTAEKIKAGVSLFLIENNFTKTISYNEIPITQIFGGNFSIETTESETNFNRNIEYTFQGNQGDCWLLSDINALNLTDWGKKAIYDAIIPDTDGSNGVTIKFKGSPLPQKNFNITAKEIDEAKKSGHYSSGDDDMIALELATEQVIKRMVENGIGERVDDFDDFLGFKSYLTGVYTDKENNKNLDITTLLTGIERTHVCLNLANPQNEYERIPGIENTLKYLSEHANTTSTVCTFDHLADTFGTRDKDDPVHGNHAYAIKKIVYGKYAIVIDPYHSDKDIKLNWKKFVNDLESIYVSSPNEDEREKFNASKPKNYDEIYKNDLLEKRKNLNKIKIEIETRNKEMAEKDKEYKLKKVLNDWTWKLLDDKNQFSFDNIKRTIESSDKDIIVEVLNAKPNLIKKLDEYQSGWGSGKRKTELIQPIINALSEKAKEVGVSKQEIETFKNKCLKELNAVFHTDEKIIISEVNKMKNLIENKK